MGVWGKDEDHESSNWKEFENVVTTLEQESKEDRLRGSLVILAVDNSTVESCLHKGNSFSPKLFDLIMRFKNVELHSGARTDGVSRGNLKEGVSVGAKMTSLCPWHLSAIDRSPHLKD